MLWLIGSGSWSSCWWRLRLLLVQSGSGRAGNGWGMQFWWNSLGVLSLVQTSRNWVVIGTLLVWNWIFV